MRQLVRLFIQQTKDPQRRSAQVPEAVSAVYQSIQMVGGAL